MIDSLFNMFSYILLYLAGTIKLREDVTSLSLWFRLYIYLADEDDSSDGSADYSNNNQETILCQMEGS